MRIILNIKTPLNKRQTCITPFRHLWQMSIPPPVETAGWRGFVFPATVAIQFGIRPDSLLNLNFSFGFVSQFSGFGGNVHRQRRRNVFARPAALQPFKLVHRLVQLPQQRRFVAQDLVQRFCRGQHGC